MAEAIIEKGAVGWWISFQVGSGRSDGHWHLTKRGIDRCIRREERRRARWARRAVHNEVRRLAGPSVEETNP